MIGIAKSFCNLRDKLLVLSGSEIVVTAKIEVV